MDCPPPPPPGHVIVIQADDLGFDDIAAHGNPWVRTPHLDRLAAESISARRFTVNPVCAPSRASFLTGRHFLRTGVAHVHGGKDFLHRDEVTIGNAFTQAGWAAGMWGKWHSGHTEGYLPWQRGFSEAFMADLYRHREARGSSEEGRIETAKWSDEYLFDRAIDFLGRHPDGGAFLYIATLTPHAPLDCPDEFIQPYREQGLSESVCKLYGMVTYLDAQIGRLLDHLDRSGLAENTLLVFMSDNGPAVNHGAMSDADRALRKVSARRGWKGDIWENGVRSPLFLRWPARWQPRVIDAPLDAIDLYPTLLELASVPLPNRQPPLDGQSWAPALLRAESPPERPIFNYSHPGWITSDRPYSPVGLRGEYNPVSAEAKAALEPRSQPISVTEGRFKLLYNPFAPELAPNGDGRFLLIDLFRDPGETTDRKAELPEVFARLAQRLDGWFEGIRAAPHAFTSPVLRIADTTVIRAKEVAQLGGTMQNTVQYLEGWQHEGNFAAYEVDVKTPGRFAVELRWLEPAPARGLGCTACLAESHTAGVTDGSPRTSLGIIDLPAGRHLLRIERSSGIAAVPARLAEIVLTPP